MKKTSRIARPLGATLLVGGALLTTAPAATATTVTASAASAPQSQAGSKLEPPTLNSATLIHDPLVGDWIQLLWNPSPSEGVVEQATYADGRFLFKGHVQGPPEESAVCGQFAQLNLTPEPGRDLGLKGDETFTITALDSQGHESAPSNGLVATLPSEKVPAPTLTSAVINDNTVTMNWTPSHTTEASGTIFYAIKVDNGSTEPSGFVDQVTNATTATIPTTVTFPDATIPPVHITKDTKISIQAADCLRVTSPLSNVLTPTDG
ncbi:MAG: hypothetical protein J2P17_29440 [Mycobacterium sp.]|nr:hypothetical protein [Mycobacterium sp.]